jgi:cyclic beta-1,2-glucan synthetase
MLAAASSIPDAAIDNLRRLQKEGALGPYGFYESIDYTAERLPEGQKSCSFARS